MRTKERYQSENNTKATEIQRKWNTKKVAAAALAAILGTALLAGCGLNTTSTQSSGDAAGDGNANNTIRVAVMTGQPDQYQIYIGQEQGIFEKNGVNVETTEYAYGINTIDAVSNGTADTGEMADFAAVNRIGNSQEQTNLIFFSESAASEMNTGGLYVAPEYADNLEGLKDSKGIITSVGTVYEYYNWIALNYIGLDPDEVAYVNADSSQTKIALVQQNNASAVVGSGSVTSYYEDAGWKLVADAKDLGIITGSYLLTTKEFSENNTELLAKYLKSLQESTDYINAHLDEAAADLAERFGVEEENFKADWQSQTLKVGFTEDGVSHLAEVADWAYTHGKYDTAFDVEDYIDTTAADLYAAEAN